jgi:hypothetical protein
MKIEYIVSILGILLLALAGQKALSQSPQNFLNIPTGSKVVFIKNITIPANEVSVPIGSYKDSAVTECTLTMAASDGAERMIPSGTKFEVIDTMQAFNSRSDLLLKSNSIRALSCSSINKGVNTSNIMSETDSKFTRTNQAQKAMSGKIKFEFPKGPKLVVD